MKHYVTSRIWDWILCVCITVGLVFHIFSGFVLEDQLSTNVVLVVVFAAVLTAIYIAFSYNRLAVIIGIVAGIAMFVVLLIYVRMANPFQDEASNSLGISVTVLIITSLLVYLACRTRNGVIAILLCGNFVIAASHFLEYPISLWQMLLFLIATLLMLLYRVYRNTLENVHTGKVRIPHFLLQSLIMIVVALVIGAGAYTAVIKPLNPPTRELHLVTKLEDMQILQVLGVSSIREIMNPDLTSQSQAEDNTYTNQLDQQGDDLSMMETEQEQQETDLEQQQQEQQQQSQEQVQDVYYNLTHVTIPWLLIIVAAAIAVLFVGRFLYKKRWRKELQSLTAENRIYNYYQYFLKSLGHAGYKKPANSTLQEFAKSMEHELSIFHSTGTNFTELTDIYIRVFYGRCKASQQDVDAYERFYDGYFRCLRKEMGIFKYFLRMLWI